jgi:hypothetical protein
MIPIFDATAYLNKPELGLPRCSVPSGLSLWGPDEDRQGLPTRIELLAPTALTALDIEHWLVPERIQSYLDTLALWRHHHPQIRTGYYSVAPKRDYWRAIKGPADPKYKQWQQENDALSALAVAVDVLFPSLYTFYDDPESWVKYAQANIAEARRYETQVYGFLWPQYHNSNPHLAYQYIDRDFWRLQLETVTGLCDGVVIWGGWLSDTRLAWNDNAVWWQVTKDFLNSLRI